MRPKDYHSVVRVWAIGEPGLDREKQVLVCAEVYCQSEDEVQIVLKEIEDCMSGKGPTVIRVGESVIRDKAISFAKAFSKADYPPYTRPDEPA